MESSILPFLPRLHKTDSGKLEWPTKLGYALKSLRSGGVTDSGSLFDFINDVRVESHLLVLSFAVLDDITTYFDEFITRAHAQNFFESILPFMGDLAFRLPALLNDHFSQSKNDSSQIKVLALRVLEQEHPGLVYMSQNHCNIYMSIDSRLTTMEEKVRVCVCVLFLKRVYFFMATTGGH
ncbi:hypothetical protein L7F22_036825 [Adiantum nelumboides]|nr:hypothetical protein [Adiantum nelumboides]